MKTSLHSGISSQSGFALISVLALVSLAALTATAFLAAARLEKSGTRSIGDTTRIQMVLNTGKECAIEVINRVGEPYWNFATTYWRTNLTDELGYPLVGKPYGTNSLSWYYYCLFTPATWTDLDNIDMNTRVRITNTICQASFSNDVTSFMTKATNGFTTDTNVTATSKICTLIQPMVGGRTSPPVGWVYIKQDIRTNPSSTTTTSLPVARFAYFVEDLEGLIDAERMGASTVRSTGTNSEEISIPQVTGASGTIIKSANLSVFTNNRGQYLTPAMLLAANGGVITDTNDLRYFATRLRACYWRTNDSNWGRVPMIPISASAPYYPTNLGIPNVGAGTVKYLLTDLTPGGQSEIAAMITNNFRFFTNRAGGMDGKVYVNALAANIVDYADTDSIPTIVNIGTPTAVTNVVGYDSYPLLTHLYDQFTYVGTLASKTITHTTWMQFWNPSTQTTPATNVTMSFTNNDIVRYTNVAVTNTNRLYAANNPQPTKTFNIPSISPNAGYVTNFIRTPPINLAGGGFLSFPTAFVTPKVWLNAQIPLNALGAIQALTAAESISNSFSCTFLSPAGTPIATITPAITLRRQDDTLSNNVTVFSSGFLAGNQYGTGTRLPIHDPRMTPYLGLGSANQYYQSQYDTTCWRGYVSQSNPPLFLGLTDPAYWPDAAIRNITRHGTNGLSYYPNGPTTGLFTNSNTTTGLDPVPCKISNSGKYTNICELGNIFDPIQWKFTNTATTQRDYANTNISSTGWGADNMWGGGSTLRIGRPEHSRFAFTNLSTNTADYPVPALGTSAVGLLDLFCVTNTYDCAGKININTAPLPVLAALAGGISIANGSYNGTAPTNYMIRAFTNGVARFRNTYPFITPSQLAFISSDYGTDTTWTTNWPASAVFATNVPSPLPQGGLAGPTSIDDQGREEWFSKIYNLTTVQSYNYRIYVKAQLTDTNGNPRGPEIRKYYQLYLRNNSPDPASPNNPNVSPVVTYEAFY